ncbi:nose resistant to fluoxetine protein 6-like isoform X2 [Leguminivora glycinivorella]|uniref:nose resistant to fluoxetine protein 6-like isoform X2 n=1 Tax=Leguminivora glycinivorella TaxID=1035111 RepID=UPI00200FD503|nr:nose resistant to fluoxetine protein 6-like isoform X2 [Leguminivora glycinivorella]
MGPVLLLFFVNLFMVGSVEFSDTLDSVPPLFDLDDWARCRRPGDVYCVLEAALVSGDPATLQLLKDYSSQSLRHFNRTLVHRGVCATRCEAEGPVEARAQHCVNEGLRPYRVQAQFNNTRSLCVSPKAASGRSRTLAVVLLTLVVLAVVATATHIITDRFEVKCPRFVLAFSLRQNWQILTYDRTKPRSDQRMEGVACMEGIRVMGMQCVIFAHVLLLTGTSFIDNPQFLENIYETFTGQAVMNSPVWLQAFFCLSGFLLAYSTLISVETKPFTPLKAVVGVVNRWMRLTPVAGIMLWFTISWLPELGSGPLWAWYVDSEAEACSERWWYHILYIHNHLPLNKLCMGHTWYLAVDMQLHILGMVLLFVLVRYRRVALPILGALLACSAAAAGLVVYWYELTPIITAQSPEDLRTLFSKSLILPKLYLPMWMNMAGYACGMAAAFVLYEVQKKGIKLRDSKVFNLIFHLSLPVGTVIVWLGVWFLHEEPPAQWTAIVYSTFDRPLVAICFALFMLGCVTKCKSALRTMFAWKGFHTLGRLSYCVFLTHFVILRVLVTSNPQLGHPTTISLISLLITASVLSHLAAIPLCLLAELPAIELFKALTEKERIPAPVDLDLVVTKRAENA